MMMNGDRNHMKMSSSMPPTTPSDCRLLALPPELRLAIYGSVFGHGRCMLLASDGLYKDIIDSETRDTAILYACSTIHEEARSVLSDHTTFEITFWDPHAMPRYEQRVGKSQCSGLLSRITDATLVGALGGPVERCDKVVETAKQFLKDTDMCRKMRRVRLHFHIADHNQDEQIDAIVGALGAVQAREVILDDLEGFGARSYRGKAFGLLLQKVARS